MENEDWVTGNVRLTLGGEPFDLQMTVPAQPTKPQRMLPIFQQLTNSFVGLSENAVAEAGETVSCSKGCGACCRQLIPLAEIEAYKIAEMVEAMPEPRRSLIKSRFEAAWRHFYEIGWLNRLDDWAQFSDEDNHTLTAEYYYERVPCPFLEDESCSIHADRPLICREYLVTSPPENCAEPSPETVKRVGILIKPSAAVGDITNSRNLGSAVDFVPLILALEWTKKHHDEFPEKTGEQWMAAFFTNLSKREIPKNVE